MTHDRKLALLVHEKKKKKIEKKILDTDHQQEGVELLTQKVRFLNAFDHNTNEIFSFHKYIQQMQEKICENMIFFSDP